MPLPNSSSNSLSKKRNIRYTTKPKSRFKPDEGKMKINKKSLTKKQEIAAQFRTAALTPLKTVDSTRSNSEFTKENQKLNARSSRFLKASMS